MAAEPLTAERILAATEEVLRRFGPAKATVVDVARALGVSHGSVYRHFATKARLREAVTERWLARTSDRLAGVAEEQGPAAERLARWLTGLFDAKRHKAGDDPELFATYTVLAGEASAVVEQHIDHLTGQLARIIGDGVARGEFAVPDGTTVPEAARAVFDATGRFHDPLHAARWALPGTEEEFRGVLALVLRGLRG